MAATVTYGTVLNLFDGQKRMRQVTVTVTGTADGSESLSANKCGLNTIDSVIGGVASGTVSGEASKALIVRGTGTGGTTAALAFYIDSGSTNVTQGFSLTATVTSLTVTYPCVVIGN